MKTITITCDKCDCVINDKYFKVHGERYKGRA
jgi:hypothetical protein